MALTKNEIDLSRISLSHWPQGDWQDQGKPAAKRWAEIMDGNSKSLSALTVTRQKAVIELFANF